MNTQYIYIQTYIYIYRLIYIYLYAFIIIIIIIITPRYQHGYPWPSLAISIVHFFRQVFRATPRISTGLLYVGSSLCLAMWEDPQEYITYEIVPTTPAVPCMSGSSMFIYIYWYIYIYRHPQTDLFRSIYISKSKLSDCSRGRPEGFLLNSYNTEV